MVPILMYITFPVMLAAFGLIGSVAGLASNLVLRLEPAAMLRNATYIAIGFFLIAITMSILHIPVLIMALFISIVLGCVSGIIIGLITEYYTGGSPVRKIAESSRSGAATNIIYGLSVGMESTVAGNYLIVHCITCSFLWRWTYLVFQLQQLQCLQPLVLP